MEGGDGLSSTTLLFSIASLGHMVEAFGKEAVWC
jgi:hypothetical protein